MRIPRLLLIVALGLLTLHSTMAQTSPELDEATKLSQLAVKLQNEAKYEESLVLAKRALDIREKALGPDDPLVAKSLSIIGGIYASQEKYSEAESAYKKSLRILEKKFGPGSKELVYTLEELAVMRFVQRDNSGAEKLYSRALSISETANGPDHVETGRLLRGFGRFYERTDRFGKATELYLRSLTILEKTLGPKDEEVGAVLHHCACALNESGKADEAKKYRERAEKILGKPEPIKSPVLQGRALKKVEPPYPSAAKQSGVSGSVVVEALVDECGRVLTARALSGPPALRDAAIAAAKGWHFTPTQLAGRPVKVIGTITFNFNL